MLACRDGTETRSKERRRQRCREEERTQAGRRRKCTRAADNTVQPRRGNGVSTLQRAGTERRRMDNPAADYASRRQNAAAFLCFLLPGSAWLCLRFFLRAPLEPVSVAITTFFWLTSGSTNRVWLATAEKCADISAARVRSELISYGAVEWSGAGRKGEQGEKEKRKRGMLGGQKEREKKEQRKKLS